MTKIVMYCLIWAIFIVLMVSTSFLGITSGILKVILIFGPVIGASYVFVKWEEKTKALEDAEFEKLVVEKRETEAREKENEALAKAQAERAAKVEATRAAQVKEVEMIAARREREAKREAAEEERRRADQRDHELRKSESPQGYVYGLTNPAMPGLIKIGLSTRPVEVRVKELNSGSGVAMPFEIAFYFYSHNPKEEELLLHQALSSHRENLDREFFKLTSIVALRKCRKVLGRSQTYPKLD
jgi:hypothetical protein